MDTKFENSDETPRTPTGSNGSTTGGDSDEPSPLDGDRSEQGERAVAPGKLREIGGRKGPDPTRYGDWEKDGRCIDF